MMSFLMFGLGILLGSAGALLMKMGAEHIGQIQLGSVQDVLQFLGKLFTNFMMMSGMALYFLSAVAWSYLLTKFDVSYVQPILALTYVVTPILAILFIGENVPTMRWVGITIVVFGVFVVAKTAG